jgi:hypothetical protein
VRQDASRLTWTLGLVQRRVVYQQAHKAGAALDDVFSSGMPADEVPFELTVTKIRLRQVMRDLLGIPISIGTVHHVLQLARSRRASSTTS